MNTHARRALLGFPLFALAACAHPQQVPTLTSAQAPAPIVAPAPVAAAPSEAVAAAEPAETPSEPKPEARSSRATSPEPLSFEALSAQLGSDYKMQLDTDSVGDTSVIPASKGLNASGYQNVGAVHQAVPEKSVRSGGDIKVSGGIAIAEVSNTVRGSSDRLRVCYERGLASSPHAAGVVKVIFTVDAHGAVSDVDAESDSFGPEVTSCVTEVFSTLTFAAPKAPPAKVTYPVEFAKQ